MFNGIISEQGTVVDAFTREGREFLQISARRIAERLTEGDSVAVDGVCLTVFYHDTKSFTAEVMPETLRLTTLGTLKTGARVNLELPLQADDFVSGHFVSGHIDGVGAVEEARKDGENTVLTIMFPVELSRFIAKKGSVAVDGVSLTVTEVSDTAFSVALILKTAELTGLARKQKGDRVNIEIDLVARYIDRIMQTNPRHSGGAR